jgi:hypothetical protein
VLRPDIRQATWKSKPAARKHESATPPYRVNVATTKSQMIGLITSETHAKTATDNQPRKNFEPLRNHLSDAYQAKRAGGTDVDTTSIGSLEKCKARLELGALGRKIKSVIKRAKSPAIPNPIDADRTHPR